MEDTKASPGLMVFDKDFKFLCWLDPPDFKAMFMAMFDYKNTGKEPAFTGELAERWPAFKEVVDADISRYSKRIDDSAYGGHKKNHGEYALTREEFDHAREVIVNEAYFKAYINHVVEHKKSKAAYKTPEDFMAIAIPTR